MGGGADSKDGERTEIWPIIGGRFQGKCAWLNSNLFISTLIEVPPGMRLAKGPKENDRLIQIYRVY